MSADYERYRGILLTIAQQHPDMSLRDGMKLARDVEIAIATEMHEHVLPVEPVPVPPPGSSVKELAEYAVTLPIVYDHMRAMRKINAIKELRALTGAHLRDAKEAIEYAEARGWFTLS